MRILFFSLSYPTPWQPAVAVFNRAMLEALSPEHEVRVLTPVPWLQRLRGARSAGARSALASGTPAIETAHCSYFYPPGLLRAHYASFLWFSSRKALRHITTRFAPDVFLAYWAHPDGAVALRAAREAGRPCVVIVGGSDVLVLARDARRRGVIEHVLRGADAVLTVGQTLRERVVALGAPPERVQAFYRTVDPNLFRPGDRSAARARLDLPAHVPIAVWAGRMVPVKGLASLLDAWARLEGSREALLYLVGDGPLRASLQGQARRLGLGSQVQFVGARPQDELADWYRGADLTVLPSLSEGIPNVLLESLACGTPFLASDVGGVREICAYPERDVVPAGNAEALLRALEYRLRSPGAAVTPPGISQADSAAAVTAVLRSVVDQRDRPSSPTC